MLQFSERGNAIYQPDGDVLTKFFWSRGELDCIQGPIGSGTSTACCHRIWVTACEQEPDIDGVRRTRWLIVRESYRQLKKTTIKTWLEWFPEHLWGDMVRTEPMTHHLKRAHPSGDGTHVDCEVIFLALDGPETAEAEAASFEITGAFVNEAQFHEKATIDEILSRCGRYPSTKNGPGATWHGMILDMNAPTEGHWVPYMRGDLPLPQEWPEEMKVEYTKPQGWHFFVQPPGLIETKIDGKLVYQPNPAAENARHLKKSYLEQIKGKRKEWIDRRVLNKVGLYSEGKSVYPTFSEVDHISQWDMPPHPDAPLIVGLDFGRDPAAAICQCINGSWMALSEVIGDNESAERFAPRVRRHIVEHYGMIDFQRIEFWGDPRGADGNQANEVTAYDIWEKHGMKVLPATSDNNPETRRSAVELVLDRRNGLKVNPRCLVLKTGLAGGYHYPKVKGVSGIYSPKPRKNRFSHIVEAFENAILGGGEGHHVLRGSRERMAPVSMKRRVLRLR